MKRRTLSLVVLALVMSVFPVTAGSAFDASSEQQPQVATANTSAGTPGAPLASAIVVEGIDIRDEHRQRALTIELRRATTPDDRAAIVTTAVRDADARLNALETELRQLRTAHQASRISDDRYEAERATITADAEGTERILDRLRPIAAQLPAQEIDDRASIRTIDRLNERASALAAGEIAASTADDTSEPEAGTRPGDDGSPAPSSGEQSSSGTVAETERPPSDTETDDSNNADAPAGSATEGTTTDSTDDSDDDDDEQDDDDSDDDDDPDD